MHVSKDFCYIAKKQTRNFELRCTRFIDLFTKNYYPKIGDVVFDVGSWNGAELPVWSRAVGESGHVYAVEANPEFYEQSLKVVNILGLKNVTCINAALMDSPGIIDIGIVSSSGLDTSIKYSNPEKTCSVPATTIDEIIEEYKIPQVNFIKMNIEGAEEFAIQGVKNFLKVKNWCISTHDFCGIPTKDFVVNFLKDKHLKVDVHPDVPGSDFMGGYLYVTNS